jgi:2'-5' RNA ligase
MQLSFAGLDTRRQPPTDRLIFAIRPDEGATTLIERLLCDMRSRLGLTGKPLGRERYHVTLHLVGEYHMGPPHDVVDLACQVGTAVALPAFPVSFDRVMSFGGGRGSPPLVLCGGGDQAPLRTLHWSLGALMRQAGLGESVTSRFTPHLTLLYDNRRVAKQMIEPIGWTACELLLVHSLLGRGRHVTLRRWPLCG